MENINHRDYIYDNGVKVQIEGNFLLELVAIVDSLIKKEVRSESKFKFSYVDENGKVVKNAKPADVENGKVKKVFDFEKTIQEPVLEHSITQDGIMYAQLKHYLEGLHMENIKAGLAKKFELPQPQS